MKKARN